MASYANLYVDQGSDYSTAIILEDRKGDLLELTDMTFDGQIRRTYQSETSYDFVISIADADNGEIEINVPEETTSQMRGGRYVYDIFAEDSVSGTKFKVLEGIVEVIPQVTRVE